MAPGRKAGAAKTEQCPHCQQLFAPGGSFTNHKRACEKAKARGESASRLAAQFTQVNDPLQGVAGVPPEERHRDGHGVRVLRAAPDLLNVAAPQPDAFAMPMAQDGKCTS
uniref:DDE-1 domain-containing protein n=1 Tax=Ganoderma boninense TaxID=34458 RepID=A0A5K1JWC2_9APHY|nr:DDE-1 domain-containing protein [Ganoderma boninense]